MLKETLAHVQKKWRRMHQVITIKINDPAWKDNGFSCLLWQWANSGKKLQLGKVRQWLGIRMCSLKIEEFSWDLVIISYIHYSAGPSAKFSAAESCAFHSQQWGIIHLNRYLAGRNPWDRLENHDHHRVKSTATGIACEMDPEDYFFL